MEKKKMKARNDRLDIRSSRLQFTILARARGCPADRKPYTRPGVREQCWDRQRHGTTRSSRNPRTRDRLTLASLADHRTFQMEQHTCTDGLRPPTAQRSSARTSNVSPGNATSPYSYLRVLPTGFMLREPVVGEGRIGPLLPLRSVC